MRPLKLMFVFSAGVHLVVIGILLFGINVVRRYTPSSVQRVRIVEMEKKAPAVSRPVEAAQIKAEEPEEVKVDSSNKKKEEDNRRLEEFLEKRKKLEELRKKRAEEERREKEKKQEELRKLERWGEKLSERKALEELSLDSTAVFPSWFVDEIHNRIFSVWEVPAAAGKAAAKVGFEISRKGQVSAIAVEKGSGNSMFDLSCQEAVRKASPFPPLPELFRGDRVRVHVTFKEE